ncbi:MAG: 16S rRNA (guanine(966)-N(2))-methyltransferase RsmD [Oscillospiraceae bacterium]|jgi:16S rRNA (guanine(966)-N(2))-methyltransferase RsmD|nr:16S rRNA (guanine(966)-N(2))-methyltransferase RsmD [Oscillospiraceae bacterium]MBP1568508.1 16S rRNA (guanine(966)-N(2))-methyltransferase RsmD [Oscillospiraceae bacterium]MBQ5336123.1 16S rRNA (guanine(966)-N(2))-methyltransferase RsmD [Oscillospiraceae bacterium]MBR3535180.1 16S rRNA (guanine(966)-N(2))-methyltransferase RsmD [Oscillospiraceae bacterium]
MRIIAGTARGRKLRTLEGSDVRPTTDKVKEAMFSAVQFQIPGATVLDLFGGSGQLGIEALSRGAEKVVFVDKSKASVNIITENIETAEFTDKSRVVFMDSLDFLKSDRTMYDLAFLDPPYNMGILEKALPLLAERMNEGGRVICEHEQRLELPEKIGPLVLKKKYKYGKIEISQFIHAGV